MIKNKPKKHHDPIDVSISDITPTTHKHIEAITPSSWDSVPVGELYDQLSTLQNRYFAMLEMGKPEIANQINIAVVHLRTVINAREQNKISGFINE